MNQPMNRSHLSSAPANDPDASVGSLLKQLARELPLLFTKELALAKAEARQSIDAAKAGVAAVSAGGAVMLAGLVILLLAALIIGIAAMVVGWAMVAVGKKQFDVDALKPDHTIHSLRKDKDALTGRAP